MAGVFNGGKLKRHAPNTWDESVREEKGFGTLTSFFKRPAKAGRPAGVPTKKRGRPASSSAGVTLEPQW